MGAANLRRARGRRIVQRMCPQADAVERAECPVRAPIDVFSVQRLTRALAVRAGFAHLAATEIAIVASELTTNVLKYGRRGRIVAEVVTDAVEGSGVRVTAFDEGPPFHDFEQALRDGSSEAGPISAGSFAGRRGIGSGLGAVQRLSHACGWAPEPNGKRVWAVRWLRKDARPVTSTPQAAPHPGPAVPRSSEPRAQGASPSRQRGPADR